MVSNTDLSGQDLTIGQRPAAKGDKAAHHPTASKSTRDKLERLHSAKNNSFLALISLKKHADHKLLGLSYLIFFTATIYFILTDLDYYESIVWLHFTTPIIGFTLNLSALRNFHFLSKKAENPGMFAQNRTMSYPFLQENLWFQLLLGVSFLGGHPLVKTVISPLIQAIAILAIFYIREFVPKTSYTTWSTGNQKVNQKLKDRLTLIFIDFQVKIVRWNYVLKKTGLFYLWTLPVAEWMFNLPVGTLLPQKDRIYYYLLNLDAMHNVTTALFLQTLKFKGFISAETFSFLFNVSPLCGVYFTYKLLVGHEPCYPYLIAVFLETYLNLGFIYPSKLSPQWKNRAIFAAKLSGVLLATLYMALFVYPDVYNLV